MVGTDDLGPAETIFSDVTSFAGDLVGEELISLVADVGKTVGQNVIVGEGEGRVDGRLD